MADTTITLHPNLTAVRTVANTFPEHEAPRLSDQDLSTAGEAILAYVRDWKVRHPGETVFHVLPGSPYIGLVKRGANAFGCQLASLRSSELQLLQRLADRIVGEEGLDAK